MSGKPTVQELLDRSHVVSIPMRVRFRGIETREALLIDGPSGWGEFAPFVEYDDAQAARWLSSAVEAAYAHWPAEARTGVPVNATVPAVGRDEVPAVLARFDGCTTAKIKVAEPGQSLADDIDRVAAVRDAMGPAARIRVDANGGWSVDDALAALARLTPYGLEYAEQPCATVEELVELRKVLVRNGIDVRIAADESIRMADDPVRVARLGAADIVVVKVATLGGVQRALDIVEACGLPAVVSSALDTSVGISAGVALAAALPELEYACGLGTVGLFSDDVATWPLRPVNGILTPGRVRADPAALQRLAAPPDRRHWWRERLRRCLPLVDRLAQQ